MDGTKYCIAEKRIHCYYKVMWMNIGITPAELRSAGIEIFAEDLTKDEANALLKLYNGEQS